MSVYSQLTIFMIKKHELCSVVVFKLNLITLLLHSCGLNSRLFKTKMFTLPGSPFFIFLSYFGSANVQSTDLKCSITTNSFKVLGNVTICEVSNAVRISSENEAALFTGDKLTAAQGVVLKNQEVFYLPYFDEKQLTNFRVLGVVSSSLKRISSMNLMGVRSLEYLDVSSNKIEYIPGKLFQFNPAIKVAIFDSNNIKAIGTEAFKNLQYLGLQSLTCYSGTAQNKTAITTAIEEIKAKCLSFSEGCGTPEYAAMEDLRALADSFGQLRDDIRIIKVLTSITFTIILIYTLISILYLLRTKICQAFLAIREKIYVRNDDTEVIIVETSSINYASCSHINETFSESTNNMENSAIYDSVYVESTVVEDEKTRSVGLRNITPNSTNYASVEEILSHLDQELAKNETIEIVWEKSKLFEDKQTQDLESDDDKRRLENQQSHQLGSHLTNAIFEHEALYVNQTSQNPSNVLEKTESFLKSEKMESTPHDLDMTPHAHSVTSSPVQETSILTDSEPYSMNMPIYDLPSQAMTNAGQQSASESPILQHPTTADQKSSYRTKIPQSMNPKSLNLANIDEKITHFEQTSPVFADVAHKLMKSSVGSQKPVNHFGFRSLTYADVAQKAGGQTDSTPKTSLKRQSSNLSSQKSPNVKDLAKKFSNLENSSQKSPTTSTNPFFPNAEASNENDDYAEPLYRSASETHGQNESEYAEPYQSQ